MALELWETIKESITAYTGLSPATFFTFLVLGLTLYYLVSNLFASSDDFHSHRRSVDGGESVQPLPPPVNVGEITADELKEYDGSDPNKPLLMAIKGQIYDVSQSRMFYGPGGPYALFAGKDASRALAKMSFEDKDLNGDLTGLGMFELEALQDWEYKFMSKYVKVGTIKTTIPSVDPITEGSESSGAKAEEASEVGEARPREIAETDNPKVPRSSENGGAKPVEAPGSSETDVHNKPVAIFESDDAIKSREVAETDDPRDQQNGIAKLVEVSENGDTDAVKHPENDHKEKE